MSSSTLLKVILRFGGVLLCSAAVAVVLPREAMVAANAWLGLAPFPDAPLAFYLARVTSALYAVHGLRLAEELTVGKARPSIWPCALHPLCAV